MNKYPECDRLHKIQKQSQIVGGFLEWLDEKGIALCSIHSHSDSCIDEDGRHCGLSELDYYPIYRNIQSLLAEFFKIDLDKVEQENQQILEEYRKERV